MKPSKPSHPFGNFSQDLASGNTTAHDLFCHLFFSLLPTPLLGHKQHTHLIISHPRHLGRAAGKERNQARNHKEKEQY
jgi:hypothetical protein